MARLTFAIILSVLTFVVGCSPTKAYRGDKRSGTELALIRAHGVRLLKVNDVSIDQTSTGALVLPGHNRIEISIEQSNFNSPDVDYSVYVVEMQAEAGVEYAITSKRGAGAVCAYPLVQGAADFSRPAGCIKRE